VALGTMAGCGNELNRASSAQSRGGALNASSKSGAATARAGKALESTSWNGQRYAVAGGTVSGPVARERPGAGNGNGQSLAVGGRRVAIASLSAAGRAGARAR